MTFLNNTNFGFTFTGLAENSLQVPFLLVFFLLVYLITIVVNSGVVVLVSNSSHLHTPMYFLLGYLSVVDLCSSCVITPKMLVDLISNEKSISFTGCAFQFFFFVGLVGTEAYIISCMSYDRYVAICQPFHYTLIMTTKKCIYLCLIVSGLGFFQSSVMAYCIFNLSFCGRNQIDHFYCDTIPLMKLSCSDTFYCHLLSILFSCSSGIFSILTILVSYSLIVSTIVRMKSSVSRSKAFHTCSSHLMCVCIFHGAGLFIYLRPESSRFNKQDKMAAVFYTIIIPMLNPLINSLRNQEVKKILYRSITHGCFTQ